ncbi:MAG TPA: response regulator [Casimicrobiaceae bacterium]|nr:response regulator [Casimicrobiaceae bacterium]
MPRLLIIEDHPTNLKLATLILQSAGHEVLGVENAADGLRAAADWLPDVILIDVQLPGMDGLEATRLLKKDEATRSIPVIALTAFAMEGDSTKMRAAGCDDYLAKPYRRAVLLEKVDKALGRHTVDGSPPD